MSKKNATPQSCVHNVLLWLQVMEKAKESVFTSATDIVEEVMNKMLSYRRETALQGPLVLAKSERLELGDNILWTLYVSLQPR